MKNVGVKLLGGAFVLCLLACTGVEQHVQPITLTADSTEIVRGDSTTLNWDCPGGVSVVSSNFGASTVSGSTSVSPYYSTTYTITVRLASTDTYTANVTVTVDDPPPPPDPDPNPEKKVKALAVSRSLPQK